MSDDKKPTKLVQDRSGDTGLGRSAARPDVVISERGRVAARPEKPQGDQSAPRPEATPTAPTPTAPTPIKTP